MINISKMNKAEVLATLYNNSQPLGMGILHYTPEDMTTDHASELLEITDKFDYLKGRVMKINLSSDILHTAAYNRDNCSSKSAEQVSDIPTWWS